MIRRGGGGDDAGRWPLWDPVWGTGMPASSLCSRRAPHLHATPAADGHKGPCTQTPSGGWCAPDCVPTPRCPRPYRVLLALFLQYPSLEYLGACTGTNLGGCPHCSRSIIPQVDADWATEIIALNRK